VAADHADTSTVAKSLFSQQPVLKTWGKYRTGLLWIKVRMWPSGALSVSGVLGGISSQICQSIDEFMRARPFSAASMGLSGTIVS
jgi:hypothetical protein